MNNIKIVHLHWGLQLIFDESQKEGNNEIWIVMKKQKQPGKSNDCFCWDNRR